MVNVMIEISRLKYQTLKELKLFGFRTELGFPMVDKMAAILSKTEYYFASPMIA